METANSEWGWTLAAWHRPAGRGAGRGGGGHRPSAGRGGERCRRTARSQVSAGRESLRRPPRPPRSWARTGPVSSATRVPVVRRACISRGCMNTRGAGASVVGAWTRRGADDHSREQRHDGMLVHRGVGASPVGAVTPLDTLPRWGVRIPRGCVTRAGCPCLCPGMCGATRRAPLGRCAVRAVLGAACPCAGRAGSGRGEPSAGVPGF